MVDDKKQLRLIAYARVSTKEQAMGSSIAAQFAVTERWIESQGHVLAASIADEGVSGGTLDRDGLASALSKLADGGADGLIVAKLDRLSRSTLQALQLFERFFGSKGAELIVLDLQVDTTTPGGRLVMRVMLSLAEFEREQIQERTVNALQYMKSKGLRYTRIPPYGHTWVKQCGQDVLADVPEEQEMLDRMLAMARELTPAGRPVYSFAEIAKAINADGGQNRASKAWSRQAVRNLVMDRCVEQAAIRRRGPRAKATA